MKSLMLLLMVCGIFMSSSALSHPDPWPGGESLWTNRNPKEYGYEILKTGLYGLGSLATDSSGKRVFFVQKRAYDLLDSRRPTEDELHSIWQLVGNEEAVYELSEGKIRFRYNGAGDPWGGIHVTHVASDHKSRLYVYNYTHIDNGLAVYDFISGKQIVEFNDHFPHSMIFNNIAFNPTDRLLYMKYFGNGNDLITFNPDTTKFAHPEFQPWGYLTFDPDGKCYSGNVESGFTTNNSKSVPVQLNGAGFPKAHKNEAVYNQTMQYDRFKKQLLIGGSIYENIDGVAYPRGYTLFEVNPATGEAFPVIEQRGDVWLDGFAVSPKGDIFISISDSCADGGDYKHRFGQIVKLERR